MNGWIERNSLATSHSDLARGAEDNEVRMLGGGSRKLNGRARRDSDDCWLFT